MSPRSPRRPVSGVLLLDKPLGLSSNQALQTAKRLYAADKAGHTGSLDPLASGMLPICFGEATKLAGVLLSGVKAYRAQVKLGERTEGDDREGEVIECRPVPALDRAALEQTLAGFLGCIDQVPPKRSALKQGGRRAYALDRAGVDFDLPPRPVQIHRIVLLRFAADSVELEVECGSGTYIRSLARDLGQALGTVAHLAGLRRLWVAPFQGYPMLTLEQIEAAGAGRDGLLLSPAQALPGWPSLSLDAGAEADLRQGRSLPAPDLAPGEARALDLEGRLVALGEVSADGRFHPKRLLNPPRPTTPIPDSVP